MTEPFTCLKCHETLTEIEGVVTETKPKPGDITLCLHCGHIMAFAEGLSFRELTDQELDEIAAIAAAMKIRKAYKGGLH